MKICSRCKVSKELEDFTIRSDRPDNRFSWCKECKRTYDRIYARDNEDRRKSIIRRASTSKAVNQQMIRDYLERNPCKDCGEKDPIVLEFDHLDRDMKYEAISVLMGRSKFILMTEMAKCEVVCANCHRRRTYRQMGYKSKTASFEN